MERDKKKNTDNLDITIDKLVMVYMSGASVYKCVCLPRKRGRVGEREQREKERE